MAAENPIFVTGRQLDANGEWQDVTITVGPAQTDSGVLVNVGGTDGAQSVGTNLSVGGTLGVTGTSTLHTVSAGVATVTDVIDSSLTASKIVLTDANKKLISGTGVPLASGAVTSATVVSIVVVNGIVTALSAS